jgi:hypothetical protein
MRRLMKIVTKTGLLAAPPAPSDRPNVLTLSHEEMLALQEAQFHRDRAAETPEAKANREESKRIFLEISQRTGR